MQAPRRKKKKKKGGSLPFTCGVCGMLHLEEYYGKHLLRDHAVLVKPPLEDEIWKETMSLLNATQRPSPSPGGYAHVEWLDTKFNLRLLKEVVIAGGVSNWYLLLPIAGVTSIGTPTSLARDSYEELEKQIKETYPMSTSKKETTSTDKDKEKKGKKGTAATYTVYGQALSTVFATLGYNLMVPKDMVAFARANGDNDLGASMGEETPAGLEILRRIKKLANDCAWHGRLHLPQSEKDRLGITIQTKPSVQLATLNQKQLSAALKFKETAYVSKADRAKVREAKKAVTVAKAAERKTAREAKAQEKIDARAAKAEAREEKRAAAETAAKDESKDA